MTAAPHNDRDDPWAADQISVHWTVDPLTGCWLWNRSIDRHGYGRFNRELAHRRLYELYVGPIPDGLHIDHLCRVRHCVRPDHLEPVTQAENNRRAAAVRTHCPHGHPLSGDNLRTRNDGNRGCKACHRLSEQRRRKRKRNAELHARITLARSILGHADATSWRRQIDLALAALEGHSIDEIAADHDR